MHVHVLLKIIESFTPSKSMPLNKFLFYIIWIEYRINYKSWLLLIQKLKNLDIPKNLKYLNIQFNWLRELT
jgi:hypothetical protein